MFQLKRKLEKNTSGRDFFIGDLHGCYDEFQEKLEQVGFDNSVDRVISVGDLIDRGKDSGLCLELLEEPWFFSVVGNHELMMLNDYRLWMMNGGFWGSQISEYKYEYFADLIKEKMTLTIEVDTDIGLIGVVHAESEVDWNLNSEHTNDINLWARSKIKSGDEGLIESVDYVVCGHTPIKSPLRLGNVFYIDTGCFHSGILSIFEPNELRSVSSIVERRSDKP